ncbi:MAG TPA: hypothetical protein VF699_01235 [Caulobacteraceae bacterium]
MKSIWAAAVAVLLGVAPASAQDDHASRWREDLKVAREAWLPKDLSYSPVARAEAERRLDALSARVESATELEITAELARIAALSDNAHTRAYLLRNRGYWRRYPIRLWKFADGWRVVAAQGEGEAMLGAEVVAIGGVPVKRAQAMVRPLFAGNDPWAGYMASYALSSPDALMAQGVVAAATVDFAVRDARGTRKVRLSPAAFERRNAPEESWWFLSPAHPAVKGWKHVLEGVPLPPSLAGAASDYRVLRCAGGTVYLQFNRAQDDPREPLSVFGPRLLADMAAQPPRKLIVDLRFNTGGDLLRGKTLIEALALSPVAHRRGGTTVLLGPSTFSAGMHPAAWFKQESRATFVGANPGERLVFWAEGGNVDLPNSKLRMHYTDRAHTYSMGPPPVAKELLYIDLNIPTLAPDREADWTWAAYSKGRDPYVEAALGGPLVCPDQAAAPATSS